MANWQQTNLLFCCSYDGSYYNGYAKQIGIRNTVQGVIEQIFSQILNKRNHPIFGCGRTDKGVHALKYFFHVYVDNDFSVGKWKKILNKMLPRNIIVLYVRQVPNNFHSRYDAIRKIYLYKIRTNNRSAFKNNYFWNLKGEYSLSKIIVASKLFLGQHNFMSYFGKSGQSKINNFERIIYDIKVVQERKIIKIFVVGSGFGRYMVRFIVGNLIYYAQNKIKISFIKKTLKYPDKKYNIAKAPPNGLYLYDVLYDFNNL